VDFAPGAQIVARILIVEDSPDNMKLFRTLLTLKGHQVTELPGGEGLLGTRSSVSTAIGRTSPDLMNPTISDISPVIAWVNPPTV
jgi:CheY-like chemotaxis protein